MIQDLRRRRMANIAALTGILFSAYLNAVVLTAASSMIVALPDGARYYALSWNLFYLLGAVSMPLAGRLGDILGKKWVFSTGIALCLAGAGASFFVGSMVQFVAARSVIGFGYGVILANGVSILGEVNPPESRGRYVALYSAMIGVGQAVFPSAAGWIIETWGWRWVFPLGAMVGLPALLLTLRAVPAPRLTGGVRIDWTGVALLVGTGTCLVMAVNRPQDLLPGLRWWHCVLAAAVFASLLVKAEQRAALPIMPLSLFKNRTFVLSTAAVFALYMAFYPLNTYKSLLGAGVLRLGTLENGLLMSVQFVAMALCSGLSGKLVDRTGRLKELTLLALAIAAGGYAGLCFVRPDTPAAAVGLYYALIGASTGHLVYAFPLFVQLALPDSQRGTGVGVSGFAQKIGGTIGSSVANLWFSTVWGGVLGGCAAAAQAVLGDYAFLLDETARSTAAERLRQAGVTEIPELIAGLQGGLAAGIRCAWLLCLAGVSRLRRLYAVPTGSAAKETEENHMTRKHSSQSASASLVRRMLPQQLVHVLLERKNVLKRHTPPLRRVPLRARPCVGGQTRRSTPRQPLLLQQPPVDGERSRAVMLLRQP